MAESNIKRNISIIEEGTSGIWTYRKWSDGTAECWKQSETIYPNFNSNYGNGFYAPAQTNQTYPSGLFISSPILFLTIYSADGVWPGISANTAAGFTYYPYCTMGGNHYLSYFAHAIGKWK